MSKKMRKLRNDVDTLTKRVAALESTVTQIVGNVGASPKEIADYVSKALSEKKKETRETTVQGKVVKYKIQTIKCGALLNCKIKPVCNT